MTASLFIMPLIFATLILISLGIYSRRFSRQPIQLPFECMMYLASVWSVTYALDIATDSLAIKIILMQVRFLAVPFIPVLILLMAILFTGHDAWLSKRRIGLLLVIPSVTAFLALTTAFSPLFRFNYYLVQTTSGFSVLGFSAGIWSLAIYLPFSYIVEIVAVLLILWTVFLEREIYARQAAIFLIAILGPALIEFLYFIGITPVPGYNLTPSIFAISGVLLAIAIFHYRFLDIVPIARTTLFERMADPMFVLDHEQRIVDFNPAAARVLEMTPAGTIGTDASVLFGKWPELLLGLTGIADTKRTVLIGSGADARFFEITIQDVGTGPIGGEGRLVILRDSTKRKLAEEALVESRRQLDAMASNIPGVVYRYYVKPDGTTGFDYISGRSRQILGLENDKVTFFDRFTDGIVPEERKRFLRSVQHAISTKTLWEFDSQYAKPSGKKIWIRAVSSPVMETGQLIFDGVIFDITDRKEADEFLRLLAHISDDAPASITVHDNEGNFLYANEETLRLHGYTREEFLAKNLHEIDVPESEQLIAERMQKIRDAGSAEFDVQHFRKDGSIFPLHLNAKPVDWGGRKVLLSIATDLSDRKKAEEALQESEDRFRAISEYSHNAICIIDEHAKILWVNDKMLTLGGYSREQVYGVESFVGFIAPESIEFVVSNFSKVLAGEPYEHHYNFYIIQADGQKRLCEKYMMDVVDTHGKRNLIISMLDITEQKRAESIRDQQLLFTTALNEISEVIISNDNSEDILERTNSIIGKTLQLDRALIYDVSFEKNHITGLCEWLRLDHPDITPTKGEYPLDMLRSPFSEIKKTQNYLESHFNAVNKHFTGDGSGKILHEQMKIKSLIWYPFAFDGHGYHVFTLNQILEQRPWTQEDIEFLGSAAKQINLALDKIKLLEERKLAEDTLLRVNQKLNVISQLTRKDLTNQTFVLSSFLELVKHQLEGQDHIIETLQKGNDAIQSIHKIVEYSKDYQDMGAKPQTWQNVKMALLFGLSHISIGKIQHSLETGDLEIFADPLLEMVCQRLCENSAKHGGHATRIRVWHTITPDGATIVFEDDGVGIPQEKKEQIFLRSEGTSASRGSLIFVKEILDITGITIRETSEPGKGARFEMVVPKGMWRMAGGNDE